MKYILDTNICSYIIKNRPLEVLAKFKSVGTDNCVISSITVAELKYWVARNKRLHILSGNTHIPKINEQVINQFLHHLLIIDFDAHAANSYGELRTTLEEKGKPIGSMDLMIAAHALSLDIILVTNNIKEFDRVPKLELENWIDSKLPSKTIPTS